jgi:phage tail sheath protein FI
VISMTHPGVYIQEVPSGVRTITGVSTSTTAFVGRTRMGPENTPTEVHGFGEFAALFGGLWEQSPLSFSVQQYFQNGGQVAVIVRVAEGTAARAQFSLPASAGNLVLEASSPGTWGDNLEVTVDSLTRDPANLFNITVSDPGPPAGTGSGMVEVIRNLSVDEASPQYLEPLLARQSRFMRLGGGQTAPLPRPDDGSTGVTTGGNDGAELQDTDIDDAGGPDGKAGLYALEDRDLFNILVIPPLTFATDVAVGTWAAAAEYCRDRRAFLIIDPPGGPITPPADETKAGFAALVATLAPTTPGAQYAGFFFPRLRAINPLTRASEEFAPSGAIAGVFARTDAARGVWKAPAGLEAGLGGILELSYSVSDGENGRLNQLGVNCLRTFNLMGSVIWGSRTVQGGDALASDWKYIPVRRLALFIEESLFRGTQWVVFEPNDEPLWAQIRLAAGAFMQNLFRQGAFQGRTPREAYFVKCDSETTTQNDINLGIVNILVGFAPLKPAEFVLIQIQQMAGQVQV